MFMHSNKIVCHIENAMPRCMFNVVHVLQGNAINVKEAIFNKSMNLLQFLRKNFSISRHCLSKIWANVSHLHNSTKNNIEFWKIVEVFARDSSIKRHKERLKVVQCTFIVKTPASKESGQSIYPSSHSIFGRMKFVKWNWNTIQKYTLNQASHSSKKNASQPAFIA